MPLFDYKCSKCGEIQEHFLKKPRKFMKCSCGGMAKRLFTLGCRQAPPETPIWSKSMGVAPDQIKEMNRIYPHHEYHPETGDLRVRNYQHQKKLAKELGMAVLG